MEKLLESLGIWRAKKSTNPVSVKQTVQRVFATSRLETHFCLFWSCISESDSNSIAHQNKANKVPLFSCCTYSIRYWKSSSAFCVFFEAPPTENPTELRPTPSGPEWFSPVIVTPPQNVTAELGVNVTLTCTAKGHPKPTIRYIELNRDFFGLCLYSTDSTGFYSYRTLWSSVLIHSKPAWQMGMEMKKGQCCFCPTCISNCNPIVNLKQIYINWTKCPTLRKTEARLLFYMCYRYIHDCMNNHILTTATGWVHPSPFNIYLPILRDQATSKLKTHSCLLCV